MRDSFGVVLYIENSIKRNDSWFDVKTQPFTLTHKILKIVKKMVLRFIHRAKSRNLRENYTPFHKANSNGDFVHLPSAVSSKGQRTFVAIKNHTR